MNIAHTSISTNFFSNLQNWSSEERPCTIEYRQNDGSSIKVNSVIVDLFSWQGTEYVLMEKGQLIRLDRLINVHAATIH